jgi:hypothetical protein
VILSSIINIRRLASIPAHLAFHWNNILSVSAGLERRHLKSLRRNLHVNVPLAHEQEIVDGLEHSGVFVTNLAALGLAGPEVGDIIPAAIKVAKIVADRAAKVSHSRHVMSTSRPDDLISYPLIYRWGLNAVLLRIAEAYLRQPVAYDGPIVFHTRSDGREIGTRKWHLDREDRRMIKVAVYLHDVDDSGGPFQILENSIDNNKKFNYSSMNDFELHNLLTKKGLPESIRTCTGLSGTVIFADTARFFHRGKPATRCDRAALFFSYFARPPRHPFFCNRTMLSRQQITGLIAELHAAQQASALWRDSLPWISRHFPPSQT